ncbi:MAG TPA: hypothetical protein VHP30_10050, partial [Ignavibacteriales bacterium]|nr:hypothetical protein [Ignavibacteriales bacterium]
PSVQVIFAQVIPYTHFLTGFLKIYQMGAPLNYAIPEFLRLSIFLFVGFTFSVIALKIQIGRYKTALLKAEA